MSRGIEIERDEAGQAVRLWVSAPAPETVAAVSSACRRPSCRKPVPPQKVRRGEERAYCSDTCRRKHWDEQHPRVAVPEQPRLDFTPAASELAHAIRGRETKAQRIVARLRQGPATSYDLARITGRFSARLQELEERGLVYAREDFKARGSEHSVYTMTREPRG